MKNPFTCINCYSKECKNTDEGTFDICKYGISYLHKNGVIEKKEPKVPLSTISKNLRPEINPILQTIIQYATKLDPKLSTKRIDLDNPLSLIIGSTVILDNFIQMITGVHEFHSIPTTTATKKINLKSLIEHNFNIYGIVKEESRTKNISLQNDINPNIYVRESSEFIKYIISVLIDNAWKYSINNSILSVNIKQLTKNRHTLTITNQSKTIPSHLNIFEMGSKANRNSKGFGYGLSWIKDLEKDYNTYSNKNETSLQNLFEIKHKQKQTEVESISYQNFILKNLIVEQYEK